MAPSPKQATSGSQAPLQIKVSPPFLIPWTTEEERNRNCLLLDLEADATTNRGIRLDLDVVFCPIPIRHGVLNRSDFYVGSTGAEVTVVAERGQVHEHTGPETLVVNYSNKTTQVRSADLDLAPELEAESGGAKAKASLGSIKRQQSDSREFTASFQSEERRLAPMHLHNSVKWTITQPRGEKAVRDFLLGNLYLNATCRWAGQARSGAVEVRPSDVRFFTSDRRPVSWLRSVFMQAVLWSEGISVDNRDGFRIAFREGEK